MEDPKKVAVVLMQFGGPDSLDAVEPFLQNLFNDPDIFELPFGPRFNDRRIREYYSNEKYLEALSARIDEGLSRFGNPDKVFLLFSAHGTPVDMVERGDPYAQQIRETIRLLMMRRGSDRHFTL